MKNFKAKILFFLGTVAVGLTNGFFGGGGGIICVPILKTVFGYEDKKSHATTVFVMFLQSIPTLIVYITAVSVNFSMAIFIVLGGLIGGVLGSFILNKIKNQTLNLLFIFVILLSGIFVLFRWFYVDSFCFGWIIRWGFG